jgi:hypothetical protein
MANHVSMVDLLQFNIPPWVKKLPNLELMRWAKPGHGATFSLYSTSSGTSPFAASDSGLYPTSSGTSPFAANDSGLSGHVVGCYEPYPYGGSLNGATEGVPASLTIILMGFSRLTENHAYGFNTVLSHLADHLVQVHEGSVASPITVVNLYPPNGERYARFLDLLGQKLALVNGMRRNIPQGERDKLLTTISFLSLDEYRLKVGEEELRRQTERLFAYPAPSQSKNKGDGGSSDE